MSDDVYRQLAKRLDAIPNGFPPTESGVELRLLAKMFTPEEAAIGTVMRLTLEPAAVIAARINREPKPVSQILKTMSRKGLIRINRGEGQFVFGLMPFVVGIYEEQLLRMDREYAEMFETYLRESKGTAISERPGVHRVIPVEKAIPFNLEIFPFERATEIIENAKSWAVRKCICRTQQKLIGRGCDQTVENCIIFAPFEGAFKRVGINRPISKASARDLLKEAQENGLIHSTGNYQEGMYYICNCCTCCCGIIRGLTEFAMPAAAAHSDFKAVPKEEDCIGCSSCKERCSFEAISIEKSICHVNHTRCLGCGLCITVCPTESLHLERRDKGETPVVPCDKKDWMVQRARERGIPMQDII